MTDAYVAGLVDGEGCISISHDKRTDYYSPRVDIGMTLRAKPILERIQSQHGGTLRKTRDATEKWEEAWAWLVVSRRAATFLERIHPLLSIKQEQARLCLCLQRMVDALPRQANGNAHWNSEARSKAHSLQIQIQNLNRKGPQKETVPGWFARVVGGHLLTPQADMFSDLGFSEFSETLPDSGWFADGFLYELQTSGPATYESGSSLWPTARQEDGESCGNHPGAVDSLTGMTRDWPTPQAHDATGARGKNNVYSDHHYKPHDLAMATDTWRTPDTPGAGGPQNRQGSIGAGHQITIAEQAEHWQTPATDSFRSMGGDRKDEMGLDQQARMFPTPASRDYRTPNKRNFQERSQTTKGEQLQNFVEHRFDLPPAPPTPDGPPSSESAPTSRRRCATSTDGFISLDALIYAKWAWSQAQSNSATGFRRKSLRKRLNPRFTEWLMGLPIGWTEP